jgi:hypothetical protein
VLPSFGQRHTCLSVGFALVSGLLALTSSAGGRYQAEETPLSMLGS